MHAVAIHYTGQSLDLPAPSVSDVVGALDFTERVYPVGQAILGGYQMLDYSRDLKPSDDGNDSRASTAYSMYLKTCGAAATSYSLPCFLKGVSTRRSTAPDGASVALNATASA